MELIHYRGLNCHLACVINIAARLGVDYLDAFSTLWSETDFIDDQKYHIYSSKRIFRNLEALGIKMEILNCESRKESEENFSLISEGELFIIGMDTFHIPWSQIYQNFHELHYFFARKEELDSIICFDPTYNKNDLRFMAEEIAPYAFELSRVRKTSVNPPRFDIRQEAREILRKHKEIQEKFLAEMNKYKSKEQKNITPLVKQITAMINNRYLFERFLHQHPFAFDYGHMFFSKEFFSKWEAVKNGIYKACILKNNENVVDEVCDLFLNLIHEETDMARKIIMMESDLSREENITK